MVNDIKKIHAALAAGTPTEIKLQMIEPTMMMDPQARKRKSKRTATA